MLPHVVAVVRVVLSEPKAGNGFGYHLAYYLLVFAQHFSRERLHEQRLELGIEPFLRHVFQVAAHIKGGFCGLFFYLEARLGGKAHGAEYPQRVLVKAFFGLAHAAYHALLHILPAAEQVKYIPAEVNAHRVHREVAAFKVALYIAHEGHAVGAAVVGIVAVAAVGGDLHLFAVNYHSQRAVFQPCGYSAVPAENLHHLVGHRRCAYIPVVRLGTAESVPHAAAHAPRLKPAASSRLSALRAYSGINMFILSMSAFPFLSS